MAYEIGSLPLEILAGPATRATEVLVRLDERLARSPVREGWIERSHFHDAVGALWVEGQLVDLDDLVFHDADMNQRAPTHELTQAHTVMRRRRRILSQRRDWALSREGVRELTGRSEPAAIIPEGGGEGEGRGVLEDEAAGWAGDVDDTLEKEFAEIDALLARSSTVLAGSYNTAPRMPQDDERLALLYDEDWDESGRLAEWRAALDETRNLPLALRAAVLLDAWNQIEVLQRGVWIGPLLVAALLRQEGLCGQHLACLHLGAQKVPWERRRARKRTDRLLAWIDAMYEAAAAGLREHDRLLLAKTQMERALRGRRANSNLPGLIDLVLARPLVSTNMIQTALQVSRQGALDLVGQLNLRELTGKRSYRAWGIV